MSMLFLLLFIVPNRVRNDSPWPDKIRINSDTVKPTIVEFCILIMFAFALKQRFQQYIVDIQLYIKHTTTVIDVDLGFIVETR